MLQLQQLLELGHGRLGLQPCKALDLLQLAWHQKFSLKAIA
jgi:hypothetical protein